ncbi:MAG: terpene cyclase/mutase family protein [Planctomycetes bacterium]|nr:terpene cyclase/mutase family protein [Planctomycetota bacterium]
MSRLVALSLVTFALFSLGCGRRGEESTLAPIALTDEVPGLEADVELDPLAEEGRFTEENPHFDQSLTSRRDRFDWFDSQAFLEQAEPYLFSPALFPMQADSTLLLPIATQPMPNSLLLANRTAARKTESLRRYGNDESERAVALGLMWLARQQHEDGGWAFDVGDKNERIAATGMALLPFLGVGKTHVGSVVYRSVPKHDVELRACCTLMPQSAEELVEHWAKGVHQRTIQSGLDYLLDRCPLSGSDAGRMSGNPYAHAIATLALCEAYALTKDKTLLPYAQAAIDHIVKTQAPNGSWGYAPSINGDITIVGWHVQAIQAARLSKDIVVPESTLKKTVEFLNHVSAGSRKAMYGYSDNSDAAPGTTQTAVGLLCRYYVDGWGPDTAGMAEGVTGLMKRLPVKSSASPDVYFLYHASQVVRFYEGDEWKTWNEGYKRPDGIRKDGMRDWLVSLQLKKDGSAKYGSFDPDAFWIGRNCGRLGTTTMSLLTLETAYRYPLRAAPPFIKIVDAPK